MPQIFQTSTNTLSRVSIFGAAFMVALLLGIVALIERSSYTTGQGVILNQPVPFSHDHHVSAIGIDCRYCHTSVEESAFAGIPPTQTCMNCHSQVWTDSPMLEPVRASWRDGVPLEWSRVHDLPDYVYFNHSVHLAKGIGCVSCHGRVDRMPLVWQAETLQMEWCLECHRNPEPHLRPVEAVTDMRWQPPAGDPGYRGRLADEYQVESLISCSTCHR